MPNNLTFKVAKAMSDIQRTLYEGESCFEHDRDKHNDVAESQDCFLRLADKVIKMVTREARKGYVKYCNCKEPIGKNGRQVNSGACFCCKCGGVDYSGM